MFMFLKSTDKYGGLLTHIHKDCNNYLWNIHLSTEYFQLTENIPMN